MSTPTELAASAAAAAQGEHPFRGLEHGWRRIARRGHRQDTTVQTCLEIVLDPERSAWVLQEAERMGLDFESYVKSLVDAARAAEGRSRAQSA